MAETKTYQISQLLLKPMFGVVLNDALELPELYMMELQSVLSVQGHDFVLEYVRPMSGGVHVLSIEPAADLEVSRRIAEWLSAREDVEYAEPDLPRR